ncbi:MAG: RimK family alpha-L-glutamate ligase [Planctomycetes bacterium]|nr:RimK family alpha-L-glutamate ligase [Planctomycetota bacterium]
MRICILSRSPALYSTRRLVEAAQDLGHHAVVVDYVRGTLDVVSRRPLVLYAGAPITGMDAVLPRVASSADAAHGAAVVRQFEAQGVWCANSSESISRASDKLATLQLLAGHGVAVPRTAYAHPTADRDLLAGRVGGAPLVLKLLQGTHGAGVVLAPTVTAAEALIGSFQEVGAPFLLQEFVAEAGGKDLRVLVVGGRIVAAMQRSAPRGDFRANLHRGGKATGIALSAAEKRAALSAARAVGAGVAGVDLVRSRRGPLVLEVNSSPGLEGIEGASGADVAGAIMAHVQRGARSTRRR